MPTSTAAADAARADARERAARTKRDRTRRALLAAARSLLVERGWHGTRMEDVAAEAGVSSATTYNHFPSKLLLVAHVYAPLLEGPRAEVRRLLDAGVDVVDVIAAHLHDLAAVVRSEQELAVPFLWAVQEYGSRVGRPADPEHPDADSDPRLVARMPETLVLLVEAGQRSGDLRPFPPAADVAAQAANLLLMRAAARREEPPALAAETVLTSLLGALRPELLVEAGYGGRPFAARPPV